MVAIIAHRGASIEAPENTLAAFRRAIELGADYIECDVQLSSDGVSVVIHDDTLDRTTNETGPVSSYPVSHLQTLDAGDGQKIPTLDEVLALGHPTMIEVKSSAVHPTHGKFVIGSLDPKVTLSLEALYPNQIIGIARTQDALKAYKNLPHLAIGDHLADPLPKQRTWVWTVDDPERAQLLVDQGAAGVITNDVATMRRLFQ